VAAKASTIPSGTKIHLTLETKTAVASLRASACLARSLIGDPGRARESQDGICTTSGWFEGDNKRRNNDSHLAQPAGCRRGGQLSSHEVGAGLQAGVGTRTEVIGVGKRQLTASGLCEMEAGAILEGESYRSRAVVVDQFEQRLPICHQSGKGRTALTNLIETRLRILELC
jgi:hypothetical protein